MKQEETERFLIEELFSKTQEKGIVKNLKIKDVQKLTGDASTRRYYRVFAANEKNEHSFVVCLDAPFDQQVKDHPFLSMQNFFDQYKINVPQVLDHHLTKGYILQEDLGNTTLLHKVSEITDFEEEFEIYSNVLNELMKLHNIKGQFEELPKLKFDFNKFMDEVRFTMTYFTLIFNKNVTDSWKKDLEVLFSPLCQRLANKNMVVTHRDFHSRNVMVNGNKLVFIDFQDARMGIPQYDLVSLLEDCYYEVGPQNKEKLIKNYFDRMNLIDQKDFSEFLNLYDDMAIQRLFKAIGSFCYIYYYRKDIRYLKYIGFAMEKLRVFLMKRSEFSHLKKTLFTYYYAN